MYISNTDKAKVLTQALPYIQHYTGKTIVVKYGGNAMINAGLTEAVISDLVLLSLVGIRVVVIHGGGPDINHLLERLGIESRFVNGLRYTDEETADLVQMVLAGKVGKNLVAEIQKKGGRAIGLCGLDGDLFKARRLTGSGDEDYGLVGEITQVNNTIVADALDKGYIPVVSTVAASEDPEEHVLNINADTAAAKLAASLQAEKLILLTDVKGLLRDPKNEDTLIPVIKVSEVPMLRMEKVITGGMIPKIDCCVEAVRRGVGRAHIIDGRISHSILIEMLSDEGIGTMIL
jgi:acetylglutamate kinase